jgi:hypothetical protein
VPLSPVEDKWSERFLVRSVAAHVMGSYNFARGRGHWVGELIWHYSDLADAALGVGLGWIGSGRLACVPGSQT